MTVRLRRGVVRHGSLVACVLLVLAAVFQPPFVGSARDHTREVATGALVAYAALRTINAAISTAKEAEVSVPIFGGFGAKPGMVLDPVDETVARIADVLFMVLAATAILGLAFGPVATIGALVAAAGFLFLWLLAGVPALRPYRAAGQRMAMLGLLLALILPASFAGGGWAATLATQDRLEAAQAALRQAGGQEPGMAGPDILAPDEEPWWNFWSVQGEEAAVYGEQDARSWFGAIKDYTERAEAILENSIDIIAIYLLRLFVFPAVFLGIMVLLVRQGLRPAGER